MADCVTGPTYKKGLVCSEEFDHVTERCHIARYVDHTIA